MAEYKNILVAVDLHDEHFLAVREALQVAKTYHAKLSMVCVVPNIPYYMASGLSSISNLEYQIEQETRNRFEKAKDSLKKSFKAEFEAMDFYLEKGSAREEIVRLAEKLRVDLIVIGSHGHRGVQRLLGSTASGVLHRAPCDVLVVRAKA